MDFEHLSIPSHPDYDHPYLCKESEGSTTKTICVTFRRAGFATIRGNLKKTALGQPLHDPRGTIRRICRKDHRDDMVSEKMCSKYLFPRREKDRALVEFRNRFSCVEFPPDQGRGRLESHLFPVEGFMATFGSGKAKYRNTVALMAGGLLGRSCKLIRDRSVLDGKSVDHVRGTRLGVSRLRPTTVLRQVSPIPALVIAAGRTPDRRSDEYNHLEKKNKASHRYERT